MQTTNELLMIRPVDFKFNEQTAGNNKFQQASEAENVQAQAVQEFDNFVSLLQEKGLNVTVVDDTIHPETPDSIFPNNWVSFHDNGQVFLYPMFSENRRQERRNDIIEGLSDDFIISGITDLSAHELLGNFLEGTGSMVLDRDNKFAYACLSIRTDPKVLEDFCRQSGYQPVAFHAVDAAAFPIYHTNVMMCIGKSFAVICLQAIPDEKERLTVTEKLSDSGHEIIEISYDQMNRFAGNMLQVENKNGDMLLIMSEQAYLSLNASQINSLEKHSTIIHSPLYTIEKNGGGSARCMLAEIHLVKK